MTKNRIVIGVDFSEASMQAAQWAVRQFDGHEFVLVHVIAIPEPPPIVSGRYPQRELLVDTLRAGAERRLRDLSESLGQARLWMEIREGPVATTLSAVSADFEARLIVVGAHGEGRGTAGGLGTTALEVVRDVKMPVLLASRPLTGVIGNVLVAVDDEGLAVESLRWAVSLAGSAGRVMALEVTTPGLVSDALSALAVLSGVPPISPPPTAALDEPGRWIALALDAGISTERVDSELVLGDPVTEILAAAERTDADLIVMGRRRAGGVRRAVLGSVTEGVLRRATRNVLVIPELPEDVGHA